MSIEKETPEKSGRQSQLLMTFQRLSRNKGAVVGLCFFILLVLAAIFAPVISPYDYMEPDLGNMFSSPSREHLMGTDAMGRDILSRLLYGGRYSLSLGILATTIAMIIGVVIGSLAGFYSGRVDAVLMRILDVFQAIPSLVFCILIAAVIGSGFINTIFALAISSVPAFSRMTRASIMGVRNTQYIEAATSINCRDSRIIIQHILPNALSPLIVLFTMTIASTILNAAVLSFIGLGVQPPTPEWGNMVAEARNYLRNYPYLIISPGLSIMISVLSLNMLGDGLRDALDPKLKQ